MVDRHGGGFLPSGFRGVAPSVGVQRVQPSGLGSMVAGTPPRLGQRGMKAPCQVPRRNGLGQGFKGCDATIRSIVSSLDGVQGLAPFPPPPAAWGVGACPDRTQLTFCLLRKQRLIA